MSKKTTIWLIIAALLVILGITLFAVTMAICDWDFKKLNTTEFETNTHEIDEDFKDILIDTDTADVKLILSDDGKCRIVCEEFENEKHTVKIEDRALNIKLNQDKKWYEHIGINLGSPKITVYLPQKEFGNLTIDTSTGYTEISKDFTFKSIDISGSTGVVKNYASALDRIKISVSTGAVIIEDLSAQSVDISLSTGRLEISDLDCKGELTIKTTTGDTKLVNVSCESLSSVGSTGDLDMIGVVASDSFAIERDTGDVDFNSCDAKEISIKTSTGDVSGSLLSEKIFFVTTDTGDVDIPRSMSGGRCEITTDTGDIEIAIK